MEQPAFSVGHSAVSVGPNATIVITVLTWTVYPVTFIRHSCALKANSRYGSKDSTQTGPVLKQHKHATFHGPQQLMHVQSYKCMRYQK